MSKNVKRIILAAIVFVALAVFMFIKFYIFKKADISVGSKKADVEMVAADLVKSFESDETAANGKYLNKIIAVKGTVDKISDNKEDISVYLKEGNESSGVMCSFDKSTIQKDAVKPGDKISVKGICSGYLMDVVLNRCAIEK
jgi:hypothetical protein